MDKNDPGMSSSRPYLVRAVYEWITDNSLTPYILVNAGNESAIVPVEHINNGKIVLNIAPSAVRNLDMSNDGFQFDARFGGKSMTVSAPIAAVLAIYAKENGRGMVFTEEGDGGSPPPAPTKLKTKRPNLRVVK
jgi:stringent starvation protein B